MNKQIKITFGKAYNSDLAPMVYRFQRVHFDDRFVFNHITRKYKSARDHKKRFYWNSEYKFWYTQSVESRDAAVSELQYMGYKLV